MKRTLYIIMFERECVKFVLRHCDDNHFCSQVVQDWSVGEMRFGRKVAYPDKTIRTETALIYDAVQLFGKALTDLDRSQVN